jgi:antibiotic biosynthesis monooxygenase (ABM) superfamily enzyme
MKRPEPAKGSRPLQDTGLGPYMPRTSFSADCPMIKRIWHGYTTPENADTYQRLLDTAVFPGIEAKRIPGYRSIELLRRDVGAEVEFTTVMTFDSLDDVIAFQGSDYEAAYVPEAARKVLKRWDERSSHRRVVQARNYSD